MKSPIGDDGETMFGPGWKIKDEEDPPGELSQKVAGYADKYSPIYDPNRPKPITGVHHEWRHYEGQYYGPAHKCAKCGSKSWGWNLWRENWEPTCEGK